jgi:hypothetical protein
MSINNQKFRPYFTSSELVEVISALKEQNKNKHLIHYLEGFAIKIERGILEPSITLSPTIENKLELGDTNLGDILKAKKYNSYHKWKLAPNACSPNELAHAKMYRYENDLMSPEEEAEYEKSFN